MVRGGLRLYYIRVSILPTEPDPLSNLSEAVRSGTALVNVALPAVVQSYDRATQTAVVAVVPCARRRKGPAETECIRFEPVNVPVLFPGAGPYSITWELTAGDTGQLVVCDRSISEWVLSGATQTEPTDYTRRHNLADGVFHPGLRSPATPLGPEAYDPAALVIAAALTRIGSSAAVDPIARAPGVEAALTALATAITGAPATAAGIQTAVGLLITDGWPGNQNIAATKGTIE